MTLCPRVVLLSALVVGACSGPTGPAEPSQPTGVLLLSEPAVGQTYTFRLLDSLRTPVSQSGQPIQGSTFPRLTRRGDSVIGQRYEDRTWRIRLLSVVGGGVRELNDFPEPSSSSIGALHPDGSRITLLLSNFAGIQRGTVHELDLATGATTPLLTLPPDQGVGELAWLPSGEQYLMGVYRPATDRTEIRRFSRASSTATGTPVGGTDCWRINLMEVSPDGRQLIFLCSQVDSTNPTPVYSDTFRSIGLDGASPAPLPIGFHSSGPVKFSPDGRFLAYTNPDDGRVWFLRLSTGERWRAFEAESRVEIADWR